MSPQLFIDAITKSKKNKEDKDYFSVLNWNIRNPSKERAIKQIKPILQNAPDIIILTEAKNTEGCRYIIDRLSSKGYDVFFNVPKNDYGVMVAAPKSDFEQKELSIDFMPYRAVLIRGRTSLGRMNVVGIYVPSRGPIEKRNVNKMKFQYQLVKTIPTALKITDEHVIVAGDLNVLERNHVPNYPHFGDWEYEFYEMFLQNGLKDAYRLLNPHAHEYSWFGQEGNGYRFDHIFISSSLVNFLNDCKYLHESRLQKISDHSIMYMKLSKKI